VAGLAPNQSGNVLIGGLGLGFTLRAALRASGPRVAIDVVELLPAVIEWSRTHLAGLHHSCLDDARVRVINQDVSRWVDTAPGGSYDAILLDVDNGPVAMVDQNNASLYSETGIARLRALLRPGGRLVVWSAGRDQPFEKRLRNRGLPFNTVTAKVHRNARRDAIVLYVIEPDRR
jgi:spermidine synthase